MQNHTGIDHIPAEQITTEHTTFFDAKPGVVLSADFVDDPAFEDGAIVLRVEDANGESEYRLAAAEGVPTLASDTTTVANATRDLQRDDLLAVQEELAVQPSDAVATVWGTDDRKYTVIDDHGDPITAAAALAEITEMIDA